MTSKLDNLLPTISDAGDFGITWGAIRTKFVGRPKARARDEEARLKEKLASLVREDAIWGPVKHKGTQYYFATGRGPSIDTARDVVVRLVLQSGVKLLSRPSLKKKVTGMNARFFPDAIKHAVACQAILELTCGKSKYYLHRDTAAEYLELARPTSPYEIAGREPPPAPAPTLAIEDILPVYRRLKAEQGGFSAVQIFDLMTTLNVPKEILHRVLIQEAKAGRVTIHHTTSVELPAEVIDAGIRLPGFAEPFVTVVVKNDQ
jgi:hypothetical protein